MDHDKSSQKPSEHRGEPDKTRPEQPNRGGQPTRTHGNNPDDTNGHQGLGDDKDHTTGDKDK